MHQIKPYLIDLSIICTALTAKLYAFFTGFTFGIEAVDKTGKCLYVLVMLITGFTAVYRFVKEIKTDKIKKRSGEKESESEKDQKQNN